VAYGFYVVAIGVKHERAIIVLVIMRTQTWRTIVPSTGAQGSSVEFIHNGARLRGEGDMQSGRRRTVATNPKKRMPVGPESGM